LPAVEDPGGAAEDSEAEPPAKPGPIVVEVDQIKIGYLQSYDDRGFTFYVPAYIFSGKMTGDKDSPFSVAIPAVDSE
jgi:hypothetical protein